MGWPCRRTDSLFASGIARGRVSDQGGHSVNGAYVGGCCRNAMERTPYRKKSHALPRPPSSLAIPARRKRSSLPPENPSPPIPPPPPAPRPPRPPPPITHSRPSTP